MLGGNTIKFLIELLQPKLGVKYRDTSLSVILKPSETKCRENYEWQIVKCLRGSNKSLEYSWKAFV